ncbi:MAG: hypothetical protein HC913_07135 [Microscillaceae bacterium]|nr:hypothetical protein [Microscillaceae bacterium]
MLTLGRYHTLTILRNTRSGLFLGDNEGNEVLLPGKFMPENFEIGQSLEVFIYLDSEDRPIATTQKAGATLRSFAALLVKSLENHGAFLDWGLDKDLFVPYAEMYHPLRLGETYLFYVYLDAVRVA